jgi:hypothetical protein
MACGGPDARRSEFSVLAGTAIKRATSAPTAIAGVAGVGNIIRWYRLRPSRG